MNQPNNRRHQETIRRIRETMLSLLEEKPLDRITVQELCSRAGINRSTFYRNYEDVADLMDKLIEEMQEGAVKAWEGNGALKEEKVVSRAALIRLLNYIYANRKFYESYAQTAPSMRDTSELRKAFDFRIRPLLEAGGVTDEEHIQFHFRFVSSGLLAALGHWLDGDCKVPVEEMADILCIMLKCPV